jgi:hypothetical protein
MISLKSNRDGILDQHFSQGFRGINLSLLRLEFLSGSFYLHFSFLDSSFSCFADFFKMDF